MIITDKFVLLAFPKTGTSFTTAVLRTIHARRRLAGRFLSYNLQKRLFRTYQLERPGYLEHRVPRIDFEDTGRERMSRHGCYRDIPEAYRHLPVAATIRDPFARYTSAFLFGMRSRKRIRHRAAPQELEKHYPAYPDITFEQFYQMIHQFPSEVYLQGVRPQIDLGEQTISFIHFFFKNPPDVFKKIDRDYIESEAFREDMVDIRFMHQENLRPDFRGFLQDMGYSEKECGIIDSFKQQNVAVRAGSEREIDTFYSPALTDQVLEKDALLFKLFPEYLP